MDVRWEAAPDFQASLTWADRFEKKYIEAHSKHSENIC